MGVDQEQYFSVVGKSSGSHTCAADQCYRIGVVFVGSSGIYHSGTAGELPLLIIFVGSACLDVENLPGYQVSEEATNVIAYSIYVEYVDLSGTGLRDIVPQQVARSRLPGLRRRFCQIVEYRTGTTRYTLDTSGSL